MKKLFLALLIIYASIQQSSAQFNLGLDIGALPLGDFNEKAIAGIGLQGQYEYTLQDKYILFGGVGYSQWALESTESGFTISMIPIQAGAKYLITEKFYAQGMLGVHLIRLNHELEGVGDREREFGLGLGVGAHLGKHFDLSGRLQIIKDFNYFAIRLGYRF